MLSKADRKNIEHFEKLNSSHQRVFKHRLRKKCIFAIKDLQYVFENCLKLDIKPDKFIDVVGLFDLLGQYEDACLLQNR